MRLDTKPEVSSTATPMSTTMTQWNGTEDGEPCLVRKRQFA